MYALLKPLLFSLEPERVHDLVMTGLALTARQKPLLEVVRRYCATRDSRLEVTAFGLRFPNPVGLAAGMDKNALALVSAGLRLRGNRQRDRARTAG